MAKAYDLRENMYALILSVMTGCTQEQAFGYLSGQSLRKLPVQRVEEKEITLQDVEDMARLKTFLSYKQIGEMYGVTKNAVYERIKRLKDVM